MHARFKERSGRMELELMLIIAYFMGQKMHCCCSNRLEIFHSRTQLFMVRTRPLCGLARSYLTLNLAITSFQLAPIFG